MFDKNVHMSALSRIKLRTETHMLRVHGVCMANLVGSDVATVERKRFCDETRDKLVSTAAIYCSDGLLLPFSHRAMRARRKGLEKQRPVALPFP